MDKQWIETASGNRISKNSRVQGASNILLAGFTTICPQATINGDVMLHKQPQQQQLAAALVVGKYCFFHKQSMVTPPILGIKKTSSGKMIRVHGPSKIGSFVMVGQGTVVKSAVIGSRVMIEENCRIGNMCVVSNMVVIKAGTVVPDRMVIPPYSYVEGSAALEIKVRDLPHGFRKLIEEKARELYLGIGWKEQEEQEEEEEKKKDEDDDGMFTLNY